MTQNLSILDSRIDQPDESHDSKLMAQCANFRAIAENAPVILWLTDVDGSVVFFSNKWLNFTGLAQDEVSGDTWVKALHPDDSQQCLKQFDTAFKCKEPVELEYRLKRFDGEFRTMIDTGKPLWEQGTFIGYVGCAVDITELKSTANDLHQSHAELRAHACETALLREINEYLQVCESVEETFPIVQHYAQQLFNKDSGALCVINDSRSMVEARATWGSEPHGDDIFSPNDCWALRKGKIHYVADPKDGLRCDHVPEKNDSPYICVPMIAQGEVMGVLHLQLHEKENVPSDYNLDQIIESRNELACTTAENLALALASLKLREALRHQSIRDPLTNLFNRRYMLETFERELCRAKRNDTSIGLIMVDVDHFKRYNDDHGHEVGDAVLGELGHYLNSQIRGEDIACRYGGEELVLVLPDAPLDSVQMRAEQIRQGIADIKLDHKQKSVGSITVSMGIASYPEHGSTTEDLISLADAALYRAKHQGRDRVEVAET